MTSSAGMIVMLFLLLLVPLVNLWIFACTLFCLFYVCWQNTYHMKNVAKVSDPFNGYFMQDELCNSLDKPYSKLQLSLTGNLSIIWRIVRIYLQPTTPWSTCWKDEGRQTELCSLHEQAVHSLSWFSEGEDQAGMVGHHQWAHVCSIDILLVGLGHHEVIDS